jgi:Cft2 family RNA processing exonuclease
MVFAVTRDNGIEFTYEKTKVILDPVRKSSQPVFITHAHGDHCKGFKSAPETYSTNATHKLAEVYSKTSSRTHFLDFHKSTNFDGVDIIAHNSGHVLGSAEYEISTPSGTFVYTGDINFRDTLVTKKAEIIPCDLLIIESTFGTPCYFPSREYMYERISEWTRYSIKRNRIPAFQTDALGNAQELISLLNKFTEFPVVTHPKVSKYSQIYTKFGHRLSFVDKNSEEASELLNRGGCAFVAPKNIDLRHNSSFNIAYVSGWGSRFSGNRKAFSLSDHSDFYRLLRFVEESEPKRVLTCHGNLKSKTILAQTIERMLKIPSSPLTKKHLTRFSPSPKSPSIRNGEVIREIMINVKPGFTYPRNWLISTTSKSLKRFTKDEVENGLSKSVKSGRLKYLHETDSYELRL